MHLREILDLKKAFFYWDHAYRLMLAENYLKTAKIGNTGKEQFPIFTKMLAVVKDILSDAKYGKKYENLIKISEKYPHEKFYALHTISTTRFAGYFHVLQAIMADMKFIIESCPKMEIKTQHSF